MCLAVENNLSELAWMPPRPKSLFLIPVLQRKLCGVESKDSRSTSKAKAMEVLWWGGGSA